MNENHRRQEYSDRNICNFIGIGFTLFEVAVFMV